MSNQARDTEFSHQQALQEAEEAARVATAERIEAARRAEAAAVAEAAARREQREIAEASASARRQAAQYAESDSDVRRRREDLRDAESEVPGEISDPYTPQSQMQPRQLPTAAPSILPERASGSHRADPAPRQSMPAPQPPELPRALSAVEYAPAAPASQPAVPPTRRPQGYRPDDASGVRQIYRGPEFDRPREADRQSPARQITPIPEFSPASSAPPSNRPAEETRVRPDDSIGLSQRSWAPPQAGRPGPDRASAWSDGLPSDGLQSGSFSLSAGDTSSVRRSEPNPPALPPAYTSGRTSPAAQPAPQRPAPTYAAAPEDNLQDPIPRRRRQDMPGYKQEHPSDPGPARRAADRSPASAAQQPNPPAARPSAPEDPQFPIFTTPEPTGPAWLYASTPQPKPAPAPPPAPQSSVADTLQHSRERVASRWYALKGVFEQPGQERPEPAPVRQKETRTPILAIFSMAGGVGKTSLVATLGRSLSSLGEKVLLTDTTSHGLLPFYFGASELRQGTVRTFSPPSGSTDAPIYLVSYDVEDKSADEAAQNALVDEITANSRGTHRVLLDLSVSSGWIVRRMARLSPTILVPVAPDMNSVISLQMVEKFFNGVVDPEGRPLKLFYLLNQFDASLPLHLDIREVLRRQLGERLLPFVIRRAPAVGEALAEGMTIIDYASDAPVAEDYLNAATWLRTVAAPATAGFRNVRWSER